MKKLLFFATILISLCFSLSVVTLVLAEDVNVDVASNGSGSTSTTNVTVSSTTQVTQINETTVVNTVNSEADTGGNTASGNTGGDVNITSGNVTKTTTITNENINQNTVEYCCPSGSGIDVGITGNGSDSNNLVGVTVNYVSNINQTNTANIVNNVGGSGNTGGNTASGNTGGDVSITSGNIGATVNIVNKNINQNKARTAIGWGGSLLVDVSANGAGSANEVIVNQTLDPVAAAQNFEEFSNLVKQVLNTGGSEADSNTGGSVEVITGTVIADVSVVNKNINQNELDSCCQGDGCDGGCDGDSCDDDCDGGDCDQGDCDGDDCDDNCDGDCDHCDGDDCDDDHDHHCDDGHCDDPGHGHGGPCPTCTNKDTIKETTIEKTIEKFEREIVYRDPWGYGRGGMVLGAMLPDTGGKSYFWLVANAMMFLLGTYLRRYSGRAPSMRTC